MQLASPKPGQNQPKIQPKTSPKLAQNLHKSQIMLNNNYKKAHHVTYRTRATIGRS
jgi:hypothetical protein